jgi:hypothetical protein
MRPRLVLLAMLASATLPLGAAGPVYNVNATEDAPDNSYDGVCATAQGHCTVRAAFMEAGFGPNPSGEEVTVNIPAGLYKLTLPTGSYPDDPQAGDLNLAGKVKVQGAGRDKTILDANHINRLLKIASGADVKLYDLTVQGGRPPDVNDYPQNGRGGGIYSEGSLALVRCSVTDNVTVSAHGGGIYVFGASLTLTVDDSEIIGNVAGNDHYGGGVLTGATTTIRRSTLAENGAGVGGGIYSAGAVLTVVNSTISSNLGTLRGGGVGTDAGTGSMNFYSSTIENNGTNQTSSQGAGLLLNSPSSYLASTIVANNHELGGAPDDVACAPQVTSVTSSGYNVITSTALGCVITGAYLTQDPQLAPRAHNGGTTSTVMLLPPSVAIDAGPPTGCVDEANAPLTTDQRGVKRPIGVRCDLGAVEVEPKGDANGDGQRDVADVFYLINALFAGGPVPLGRADVDGIQGIDVRDIFYLINFLFAGGPAPV